MLFEEKRTISIWKAIKLLPHFFEAAKIFYPSQACSRGSILHQYYLNKDLIREVVSHYLSKCSLSEFLEVFGEYRLRHLPIKARMHLISMLNVPENTIIDLNQKIYQFICDYRKESQLEEPVFKVLDENDLECISEILKEMKTSETINKDSVQMLIDILQLDL